MIPIFMAFLSFLLLLLFLVKMNGSLEEKICFTNACNRFAGISKVFLLLCFKIEHSKTLEAAAYHLRVKQ